MKNLIVFIVVYSISVHTFSNNYHGLNDKKSTNEITDSFCDGWEAGYKAGYCYLKIGCSTPYAPVCPVQRVGESTYQDGYNRGFVKGKSDNTTSAYKQVPKSKSIGEIVQEHVRYNNELDNKKRIKTESSYLRSMRNAKKAYKRSDYEQCVFYYEMSKKMGWYNSNFEYLTAVSYYELYKKYGDKKYKKKAKKLFKLSKKHGNIKAKIALGKIKKSK